MNKFLLWASLGIGYIYNPGFAVTLMVSVPFEFLVCPFVFINTTAINGMIIVGIISIFVYGSFIFLYDWAKKDFFLIENVKSFQENHRRSENYIIRTIARFEEKGRTFLYFFLLAKSPFFGTIYFRKGAFLYNGLRLADIRNFFIGIILSTIWLKVGTTIFLFAYFNIIVIFWIPLIQGVLLGSIIITLRDYYQKKNHF